MGVYTSQLAVEHDVKEALAELRLRVSNQEILQAAAIPCPLAKRQRLSIVVRRLVPPVEQESGVGVPLLFLEDEQPITPSTPPHPWNSP
jgi:hypothetical protein